jgi:hypothetical protein
LEQAILDLVGATLRPRAACQYDYPRFRYFTRLWFESDNYEPGSFRWICDQLELDASWIRRRLFAIAERGDRPRLAGLKPTVRTARVCTEEKGDAAAFHVEQGEESRRVLDPGRPAGGADHHRIESPSPAM